jgi:membrane dipeptidase
MVLDGHTDTPQRFLDEGWQWTSESLGVGQLSADTAREGGLAGSLLIA